MKSRILVVDDEKMVRWGLCKALQEAGYEVDQAENAAQAVTAVQAEVPDMVLLDFKLPDRNGIEVLADLRKLSPHLPVVMITAHASISGAVEAMKLGAYDYLGKPFELDDVAQTVARGLEAARLREGVTRRREETLRDSGIDNIVAESPKMLELLRLVRRIAVSEATTILLLGESGVGKGVISRTLHAEGAAGHKSFMHITCTALSESLLESELFGHEKGAFTDAKSQKKGLFELADGGTIFLDEIGDLSPGLQGKLLRFLEDKAFRRVGGVRDIQVSVRIIAATNKDLAKEVEEGRFRSDLYFRLKVIPIDIPPLRERVDDVLPLAASFIRHFNHEFGKSVSEIQQDARELMLSYPWPGNVRELRNAIERAVLLSESNALSAADLPVEVLGRPADPGTNDRASFEIPRGGLIFDELEKHLVEQALRKSGGNRTKAAGLLGMNRDQIRYRIEKYGLGQSDKSRSV